MSRGVAEDGAGRERDAMLRQFAPQVLGAVVRRYGHFDLAEDATQEALLAAATQWPRDGAPGQPLAWLITVASRRMTDLLRSEQARRRREDADAQQTGPGQGMAPGADEAAFATAAADDTLVLLLMCCHPTLSPASQIALTLRVVGGLSTPEIARAFLVPEATMTRRITRAKQRIADTGTRFALPTPEERPGRLVAALHVLYLIFNEGYAATSGPRLQRVELAAEAIRLARIVHRLLPDDPEATGLLALMQLIDARREARTGQDGELVAMADQDRRLWNTDAIAEGITLVTDALSRRAPGPYQLQAAIAAVHGEAPSDEATDWPQIVALYEVLMQLADNPVVALNHAVAIAIAMAHGARAGLDLIDPLRTDARLADDHRLHTVRGHLLERADDPIAARDCFLTAARLTANVAQQRYLSPRRPPPRQHLTFAVRQLSGPAGLIRRPR